MKYTTFLFVNAAASVLANLDSRQEAGKPAVDCGGEIYDEVEDSNAWIRGCWESTFPPEEPLEFPIEFENKENFNFTEAYPLYEFPLIHGEEPWSGGEPGPDRAIVYVGVQDDGSPFCGLAGYVTSRGDGDGLSLCKDILAPGRAVSY